MTLPKNLFGTFVCHVCRSDAYLWDKNAFIYIVRALALNDIVRNETKQQFADIIIFMTHAFMYNLYIKYKFLYVIVDIQDYVDNCCQICVFDAFLTAVLLKIGF